MFGNEAGRMDRRVVRTRDVLGEALRKLLEEKPFDEITVGEVLERAGVARSTFYKHYRDKDDLFLSDAEDFFAKVSTWLTRSGAERRRLAPVKELFGHMLDVKPLYAAMLEAGKIQDVLALAQGMFARTIAERLRLAGVAGGEDELAARGCGLAGSLFGMLDFWMGKGMKAEPEAMDRLWHGMAWSGVKGA